MISVTLRQTLNLPVADYNILYTEVNHCTWISVTASLGSQQGEGVGGGRGEGGANFYRNILGIFYNMH